MPVARGDHCGPLHSSGASCLTAVWECFKCKKQSLITALAELEAHNVGQPDMLHHKALDLKEDLKDPNVNGIIVQNKQDPDLEFLKRYGEDPDNLVI